MTPTENPSACAIFAKGANGCERHVAMIEMNRNAIEVVRPE
jgi:hypothetical protein